MELKEMPVESVVKAVGAPEPVPGSGSVAALQGAFAVSLALKSARITEADKALGDACEKASRIAGNLENVPTALLELSERIASNARALGKAEGEERQALLKSSAETLLDAADLANKAIPAASFLSKHGSRAAIPDALAASSAADSAVQILFVNVRACLESLKDKSAAEALRKRGAVLSIHAGEMREWIMESALI